MIKNKRFMAFVMASVVGITTLYMPVGTVNAEEIPETIGMESAVQDESKEQEYIVLAKNDKGMTRVENTYGDAVIDESELLEENYIAVVEMTESEAEKLEENNNILLVEEDILFEGSDFEEDSINEILGTDFNMEDEAEIKMYLKELHRENVVSVDTEEQWNIDAIHANEQEYREAGEQVKIAVMDTGVTATEDIDVAGRINFIQGEEDVDPLYEDVSGHGTAVASVIAAKDNEIGITGVNPNAELYSVKVLNDDKQASLSGIIKGIYWCIENDIDIINMSFGTTVKSEILEQVIKEADNAGILMIAAAGNLGEKDGESTVEYPAAFDEVMAVGAMNPQGEVSDMSSVGAEIELMAPGESVLATGYYNEIICTDGTSMAAPHVAGAASILWAKDRSKSRDFIRALLNASAAAVGDTGKQGNGVVDLEYALSVYDEFAEKYIEDLEDGEKIIEKNPAEIENYENVLLEARWVQADHEAAVGAYDQTSASALKYIKIGSKLPDQKSYMKFTEGSNGTGAFHGQFNYVGNYMYIMRMARICYHNGMDAAYNTAVHPNITDGIGYGQLRNRLVLLKNDFGNILGSNNTQQNQARILVGIASHIAMDAYAHKAYEPDGNGGWVKIPNGKDANNVPNGTENKQDRKKYVESRWTCAKAIAYDIVDVWHYGSTPDAIEFYQSAHNSSKFKLFQFAAKVRKSDPQTYAQYGSWFENRSFN